MTKNWRSTPLSAILIKDEKERETPLDEFKFHYEIGNSIGTSDKYFLAHDLDEASEMFEYACTKRKLDVRDPS